MLHKMDIAFFECVLMDIFQLASKPVTRTKKFIKFQGEVCSGLYLGEPLGRGKYSHDITISREINTNSEEVFATMAHEYVHAFQMENDYPVDHLEDFDLWDDCFIKWFGVSLKD